MVIGGYHHVPFVSIFSAFVNIDLMYIYVYLVCAYVPNVLTGTYM